MEIESYSFGNININGKNYTSDLIILANKIKNNWWRKEGHYLHKEDLSEILEYQPNKLIIGTGKSGRMTVPENLIKEIEKKNITVKVVKTDKAVKLFNQTNGKIAAALHLTC